MKVGFVGLGVMGKSMALNLLKNKHETIVYDLNEEAVKELVSNGAKQGKNLKEIAKESSVIFTSLPNSKIVEEVILGKEGLLEGCKKKSIIVDLSSISPKVIKKISEKCLIKEVSVLDAPVSGGAQGAKDGTLSIMAGGEYSIFKEILPLLECIGNNILHVGNIGAGDTVKIINNLLLGINMAAAVEGISLGVKAGVDPKILFEVISKSSGNSYAFQSKYPKFISKGNFEPGFMIDLQSKDLQLAIDLAQDENVPLIFGSITKQIFEIAKSKGYGKNDISSLIKIQEEWLKIKIREE